MNKNLETAVKVLLPAVGALAGVALMEQTGYSEYIQNTNNLSYDSRVLLDVMGAGAGACLGRILSDIFTSGRRK